MTAGNSAQPLTREVLAWMAEQVALGHSEPVIHAALLAAGWRDEAAQRAIRMMPVSGLGEALPVPGLALEISGQMVDAGDRWVEVLEHRDNPAIVVFGKLLSEAECVALIDAARPRLTRSLTVDTLTGGEELNADRTSQGMFFSRGENRVVRRVEARIARLLGWPQENGEGLQILRYGPGAEYKPHYDYFDPAQPGTPTILKRGGQRVATLIIYLHEPEQGGATVFPAAGLNVAPRRGNAVFFSYSRPHPSSLSLHGGEPVAAGEKWIATKWLREREFI
jgi:prolyl 4-hydroxylase